MIDPCPSLQPSPGWSIAAAETPTPELFLATLGQRLIEDGAPLAGGALTLASPHPLIARRTWLWRAESNEVVEALGFVAGAHSATGSGWFGRRRPALACRASRAAQCMKTLSGSPRTAQGSDGSDRVPFTPDEAERLREAARFAAAPLAALTARATLTAALEAYLGRRSAARVLAGPLAARNRRDDRGGAAVRRPARLHGAFRKQLRPPRSSRPSTPGSTASPVPCTPSAAKCSNSWATACWRSFRSPAGRRATPATPRSRRSPPRGAEWPISTRRGRGMGFRLCRSASALHLGEMLWGNIGAADRLDFTAIGPAVNLVSRLEGLCRPLERTVLISGAFAAETGDAADPARNARFARHRRPLRRVHCGGLDPCVPSPSGEG